MRDGDEREDVMVMSEFENILTRPHLITFVERDSAIESSTTVGAREMFYLRVNQHTFRYNTNEELQRAYDTLKEKLTAVGVFID